MNKYLAVLVTAMFLSLSVTAKPMATATAPNGDWIQLNDDKCSLPAVVAAMGPVYGPAARQAVAVLGNQKQAACWVIEGDTVGLMFDDGGIAMIPKDVFKNAKIT